MMNSERLRNQVIPSHRIAEEFHAFERRGRGWDIYQHRVRLEPMLPAFSQVKLGAPVPDDARRPTALGTLIEKARTRFKHTQPSHAVIDKKPEPAKRPFQDSRELVEMQIALPPDLKVTPDAAESFLLSLSHCTFPISFEIVGFADCIKIQFVCRTIDHAQLEQQLVGHFPELIVAEPPNTLDQEWAIKRQPTVIADFGLSNEFMIPLGTFRTFEPDPLIALIGALSKLRNGELGMVQILFQAVRQNWAEHVMRAVVDAEGKPLFTDAPEVTALAKQKIAHPLFAVVLRVAARCESEERAWRVARNLGASLRRFSSRNELMALSNDNHPPADHERDVLDRATHRSGMLLNSEELAAMVHVPSVSVRSEKLRRDAKHTRPAPVIALGHQLVLGHNTHRGRIVDVTLGPEQRMRHMFIAGSSGSGKTTLIKQLATQDIQNGEGLCVIDPHGDLINDLLAIIPEERFLDVIVFDPADEWPVPFNVLSAHSELEKNLLASDLASLFRRQCTTWGDQLNAVLTNSILAFVESTRGGTLADLRRFLVEAEYRKEFLRTVGDEELLYYWTKEFPLLRGHPQAPILTRLNAFLRPKPIRNMVSQQTASLDLRAVMDNKKILLVKLAQGAIGVDNSHLLGSLILSKVHQLALSRQDIDESRRADFFLYCDEAQFFIAPSVTALLSGARKFHVGLTLATQEFYALWNLDKEVASAVLANPFTRVAFRLGDVDAKKLEFSHFNANDLQNLGVGEAIVRLERNDYDFNLKTLPPHTIDPEAAKIRRQQITELSRKQYGRRSEQSKPAVTPPAIQLAHPAPSSRRTQTEPGSPIDSGPIQHPSKQQDQPMIGGVKPTPLGRGGQQHKYLQNLIKRLAEDKGYHVTIERAVLSGTGSVDVTLERTGRKIACEISVASTTEYELKNVQKCLAAGFDQVVVLSSEKKALGKIQKSVQSELDSESSQRVLCLLPEQFIELLDQDAAEQLNTEGTVHGYKVKVKYKASGNTQQTAQRQAIAQVILQALKRLKDEG